MRLYDKIIVTDGYKPFSNGGYKIVWLNDDKALIKFLNGKSHTAKGDILSFTKVNGPYSNVLGNLNGVWISKNNKEDTINVAASQITFKDGEETYLYSSIMSNEQGNYGTILFGTGTTPNIYILMNGDNTITVGFTGLNNNAKDIYIKK